MQLHNIEETAVVKLHSNAIEYKLAQQMSELKRILKRASKWAVLETIRDT